MNEKFITHPVLLEKNDLLLLSTDGYADQFDGNAGKKMKSSNLSRWIEENIEPDTPSLVINDKLLQLPLEWKKHRSKPMIFVLVF